MNPKVSVVVPVYNVEKFLDRTMTSLLAQTLEDIEIVLVDDGSPDNCPAICDHYAQGHTNVKVVHKNNAGLGMACNSGLNVATGEYVAFCDSDDYVDYDMYEVMYQSAKDNDADAVYTGIKTVNQHGDVKPMNEYAAFQVLGKAHDIQAFAMDMIASEVNDSVERHVPMSAKVALYRRKLVNKHQLRFVSERVIISEDLVWNMDVLCHSSRVVILPKTFYYYYNNTSSLSKKVRTDRFPYFKVMRQALIDRSIRYKLPTEAFKRIDKMFIGYSRFFIGGILKSNIVSAEKKSIVRTVCKDKIWKDVYEKYPVAKMPKMYRLMTLLMRNDCYTLMSMIYKLKR